jgi:hypothetical protein
METTQKARRDPETLSPLPLSGDDSQRDEERAIGTAYRGATETTVQTTRFARDNPPEKIC